MAPASFFLEEVHPGDGFLGGGEQRDRAGVKEDRPPAVWAIAWGTANWEGINGSGESIWRKQGGGQEEVEGWED